MFDHVHGELACQPDRKHLDLEWRCQFGASGDVAPVGGTELSGTVYRRRAHQISNGGNLLGIGLAAHGELVDDVFPQADRTVGPAQRQLARPDPAGLLKRHVGLKTVEVGLGRCAVEQREGRVPRGGDDAIRTHLLGQVVSKGDKAVDAFRPDCAIYGASDTAIVDFPDRSVETPALSFHSAQQYPQE